MAMMSHSSFLCLQKHLALAFVPVCMQGSRAADNREGRAEHAASLASSMQQAQQTPTLFDATVKRRKRRRAHPAASDGFSAAAARAQMQPSDRPEGPAQTVQVCRGSKNGAKFTGPTASFLCLLIRPSALPAVSPALYLHGKSAAPAQGACTHGMS